MDGSSKILLCVLSILLVASCEEITCGSTSDKKIDCSKRNIEALVITSDEASIENATFDLSNVRWVLDDVSKVPGNVTYAVLPCMSVKSLSLSGNMIFALPPSLGRICSKLETLSLNNNSLYEFSGTFPHLRKLDFSFNGGSQFNATLPVIEILVVSRNSLLYIPTYTTLTNLDISRNDIVIINPTTFKQMNLLKILNVSDNPIKRINDSAFGYFPNLEMLDLSKTFMENITKQNFNGLTQLRAISLATNDIRRLNQNNFKHIVGNLSVDVSGNTMLCDCFNVWLRLSYCTAPMECISDPMKVEQRTVIIKGSISLDCPVTDVVRWVLGSADGVEHTLYFENTTVPSTGVDGDNFPDGAFIDSTGSRVYVNDRNQLVIVYATHADYNLYSCYDGEKLIYRTFLYLDVDHLFRMVAWSMVVGIIAALLFLAVTLTLHAINYLVVKCRKLQHNKDVQRFVRYVQHSRTARADQFNVMKDKCNNQMTRISSNYQENMNKLNDSYTVQVTNLRKSYNTKISSLKGVSTKRADSLRQNYQYKRRNLAHYCEERYNLLKTSYELQRDFISKVAQSLAIDNCRVINDEDDPFPEAAMAFDIEMNTCPWHLEDFPSQLSEMPEEDEELIYEENDGTAPQAEDVEELEAKLLAVMGEEIRTLQYADREGTPSHDMPETSFRPLEPSSVVIVNGPL